MDKPVHKIAHILPWPNVGGTEMATLRLIKITKGSEYENIAFVPEGADNVVDFFNRNRVETAQYRPRELSYHNPAPFLGASFKLAREFRRLGVDMIHCSDFLGAVYAAWAGKLARIPVLSHVRCRFQSLSRRQRSFLYPVDHFAFVSKNTWDRFGYHVRPDRGTVLYDGFDATPAQFSEGMGKAVRRDFGIPADAIVVGTLGRVAPAKDYVTLVKAARTAIAAESRKLIFLIVGDHSVMPEHREHYEEISKLIREAGLSTNFVFTGFQSDVAKFLDIMDIFVLSTHQEGMPLVILEAMASGRPVIATDVDGVPEIVSHDKTGLLFPHQDDTALSCQILALLRDRSLAKRLAAAGREAVASQWSARRFGRDVANLYRRMLEGSTAGVDQPAADHSTGAKRSSANHGV